MSRKGENKIVQEEDTYDDDDDDDVDQNETEQMVFDYGEGSAKDRINHALKQLEDLKTVRHGEDKSSAILKPRSEIIVNLTK